MASQGPRYPVTVSTESVLPEDDNDWTTPGNVGADDGAEATITAATYDANDISFRLKAQNFGFTIPGGATIDGIVVEIEKRDAAIGNAVDERVQLLDAAGALVGDNKADTVTGWPTAATIISYGGAADLWNAAPTPAMVNDPDFGVVLSAKATAANTDIFVDFVRVTVHYTAGAQTFPQALPATAVGVAAVSRVVTYSRSLPATGVGVPVLTKGLFQTLAATAVGAPTLATALLSSVTMAATAVGVGTLTALQVIGRTLAAVATGVAGLATQFIAGEGPGGVLRRAGRWFASHFQH